MRCFAHQEVEAVGLCKVCGKGLCPKCARQDCGWLHCGDECARFSSEIRASVLRAKVFPQVRRKALGSVALASLGIGLVMLGGAFLAGKGDNFVFLAALGIVFLSLGIVALVARWRMQASPA